MGHVDVWEKAVKTSAKVLRQIVIAVFELVWLQSGGQREESSGKFRKVARSLPRVL